MHSGIEKTWLLKVGHCKHPGKMADSSRSWRAERFPALVALIKHRQLGFILFDTGYTDDFNQATSCFPERLYRWVMPMSLPAEEALLSQLARIGVTADEIRYVFISHFHADHISGLKQFNHARFICSRTEYQQIKNCSRFSAVRKGFIKSLLPDNFEQRCLFIEDHEVISLPKDMSPFHLGYDLFCDSSCIAIGLPGHSQGQFGLRMNTPLANTGTDELTQPRSLFFIADSCWCIDAIIGSAKPLALANFVMESSDYYNNTVERLRTLHKENPTIELIPSHCKKTFARLTHV